MSNTIDRSELPVLTYKQRADNLRRAVDIRTRRAEVKAQFREGEISLMDIIEASRQEKEEGLDQVVSRIRVIDLIKMRRGIGPRRAEIIMGACHISPNRRVGGLGHHQIEALMLALDKLVLDLPRLT